MSYKLISESNLSNTADAIREKLGVQDTFTPSQFANAIASIGGGSWAHIAHAEYEVSTTSTSASQVGIIEFSDDYWTASKMIYVRVRDKAGPRSGYYVGNDSFMVNYVKANMPTGSGGSLSVFAHLCTRRASGGLFTTIAHNATAYGVYPYSLQLSGTICKLTMRKRYNSTATPIIDGTYSVDVFALEYPDGYPSVFDE